jgi:hypothetical protein
MTKLTSALVREGLARLAGSEDAESTILREEPPALDPFVVSLHNKDRGASTTTS